jgi:hypothetical protein
MDGMDLEMDGMRMEIGDWRWRWRWARWNEGLGRLFAGTVKVGLVGGDGKGGRSVLEL